MSLKQSTRRGFLVGTVGTAAAALAARVVTSVQGALPSLSAPKSEPGHRGGAHAQDVFGTIGEVDHARNGFHPMEILADFNYGDRVYQENGRTVRDYAMVAVDREIEIAPGIFFP